MSAFESPPTAAAFAAEQARREDAERRLAEQRQLLARLVHDFRSPLNAIAGFAEIMEGGHFGPLGDKRYEGYARDIRMSALQLAETVAEMLDQAKFEAGQPRLADERLNLREIVEGCLATINGLSAAKGIEVSIAHRAEVALTADRRALHQIFVNLVSNAVKFSTQNATVCVDVDVDAAGRTVLTVADGGCGIALDDLDRVKIPYAHSRPGSCGEVGTGLGLSIVAILLEQHGGTLEIDSVPDKGTTVRAIFPEWRSDAADRAASAKRAWR
jgi:two-component system, cell cycle sensor histidine kinase PleC